MTTDGRDTNTGAGRSWAPLRYLRFLLALVVVVSITVVGASGASAAEPAPAQHERGSGAGQSDSPRGTAPPSGGVHDPATTARPRPVPDGRTEQAIADKARAEAGFRSPNQKPIATDLGEQEGPETPAPAQSQTLATTFPGISDTGTAPPDTIMAAGPSNILLAVNSAVAVYTKVGTQVSQQPLSDLFSAEGQPAQDLIFDPWVAYDPYIDRFWLVAASVNDNPERSTFLLAVSDSSEATTGWSTFSIDATLNGDDPSDTWCDRPTLGFDTQAIYLTCNMFSFPSTGTDFAHAKLRVMTKGQFLAGSCCRWWDFWDLREGFLGLSTSSDIRPAQMLGATDADGEYLVDAHGGGGSGDTLEVWHITDPGNCCGDDQTAPNLEQSGRDVGSYDPPPDTRQQGTSATLDSGDTRLLYAFWQDGHVSTGHNLACPSVDAACVGYTEVDVADYPDMSLVNDWILPQDESVDRLYPAVAPNAAGEKAMVFSVAGPDRFAGTSFVLVPDSSTCTNCFQSETSMESGLGSYGSSDTQRWGDYSGASPDPDGDGVWVAGEFASIGRAHV